MIKQRNIKEARAKRNTTFLHEKGTGVATGGVL